MSKFQDISAALEINGKIPAKRSNYAWLKFHFKNGDILKTIEKYETDGYSVRELNVLSKLNIQEVGLCQYCKVKRVKFQFGNAHPVSRWCSGICANKDPQRAKEAAHIRDSKPNAKENAAAARKASMVKKYGVEFNSQRQDIKEVWTKPRGERTPCTEDQLKLLLDYDWLYDQHKVQLKTYEKIASEFNINKSKIQFYIRWHGIEPNKFTQSSQGERDMGDYIQSLGFSIQRNIKNLSTGNPRSKREIDILVPSMKVGFEFDGLYHHSCPAAPTKEEKLDHLWKIKKAAELDIHLLRFTDNEWDEKQEIVKSIIKSKLGITEKIYGRQCDIKEVSTGEAQKFLDSSHLNGYSMAGIKVGLYYKDELVSLCTFGQPRFDKTCDWEIIRFASKLGTTVVGGLSKILKYFRSRYTGSILTYADQRISNGNSYQKVGFKFIRETEPGYIWIKHNHILTRYQTQKKNLPNILKIFDPDLSEADNMFANGYRIYYNCGNLVYKLD